MYVDIVESLRCPNPHAESALVGVFSSVDGRDVVEGVLGCPVCRAEFSIRDGVVWLSTCGSDHSHAPEVASDEEAMRIAAFLNLTEPHGFAVLQGRWAAHALIVNGLSPTHLVLLDPPTDVGRAHGLTIIRGASSACLAKGSAHALAVDVPNPEGTGPDESDALRVVAALAEVVRPGGRVMAPVAVPLPAATRELVRDARVWVAERVDVLRVVSLKRSRDG